tara:strand:- start:202 stop:1110 length:909 start_codon:yes stop_codon:yes gene_type:complete
LVILKKYKKIAIILGGISEESKISMKTGNEVFKHLKNRYETKKFRVTSNVKILIKDLMLYQPDVVFNALHGKFGEDGQIQAILNALKIPYTHSGFVASLIGMNKKLSKLIFEHEGILCPKGRILNSNKFKTLKKYQFPIIIKPNDGGSSVNILRINKKSDLLKVKLKGDFLVEEFIEGREITVGILENKICGITEIVYEEDFYDYKNKYVNIAKHVINPRLPKKIIGQLKKQTLQAHNCLGCNCLSRADYRYNEKDDKLYLLEINTQPGLTKNSLLPEMANNKGISFFNLCEIVLKNAKCEK